MCKFFFVLFTLLTLSPVANAQRLLPGPERNTRAAAPNGLGNKKVAAILFNYVDKPLDRPISPASTRQRLFTDTDSTNAFAREVSFGLLAMVGHLRADGDVFGWYSMSLSGQANDKSTLNRIPDINQRATVDGFDAANYDVIFYIHPPGVGDQGWGGQAFGPKEVEMWGMNPVVAAHEMFHILGLDHANGLRSTINGSPVPVADDFTSEGYADPFDIQANSGYKHPSAYFKARMGWFLLSNFVTVPRTASRTYSYRIKPIERATPEVQVVRIPIPRSRIPLTYGWGADATSVDLFYYLEFRQPSTFDAFTPSDPVVNGVSIRLGTNIDTNHMTLLVDTQPETASFSDAPLTAGRIFRDAVAGVTVRTVATSPLEATVEVTMEGGATISQGPHLLWSRTDGMGSLWSLDANGNYLNHRYYGSTPYMTAMDYTRVGALGKMLWARSDGMALIWTLDECDNIVSIERHGPFPNWTPRSYQKLADGTARLLWSRADGLASIWTLNGTDDFLRAKELGPYPNWTAKSYQRLTDGTARLLWSRNDGLTGIWRLNDSDSYVNHTEYGPFLDWTANGYERRPDGSTRVVWSRTDGTGSVWSLDSNDAYLGYVYHGPFVNWTARAYSSQ